MLTLSVALSFFISALLLAYAPGPDILFVLAQSAVHGPKAGIATTLGLMTGVCVHTWLVAAGLATLILASPTAFFLLKALGAAYLLYLARLSWKAAAVPTLNQQPPFPGYLALYKRGIIMNLSNPKVSMFFLALLPQFCDPARGSVAIQCLSLGCIFILTTIIAFSSVSFFAGYIFARFNSTARGQVVLNKACALLFLCLAALLLFS